MSLTCIASEGSAEIADFVSIAFTALAGTEAFRGDGSMWEFNRDTAERDLTAFELLTILNMTLNLCDGVMGKIKEQPHLLRHFRRRPPR